MFGLARLIAAAMAALLGTAVPALAAPQEMPNHDEALAALGRGEVRPLSEILEVAHHVASDKFIDVGLDRSRGRWVYEMTLLTDDGRYRVVTVDAATAQILSEELR